MSRAVGTVHLMIVRVVGMILQMVAVPIYLARIGEAQYGVYYFAGVIFLYLGLWDPGFTEATMRVLARLESEEKHEEAVAAQRCHVSLVLLVGGLVLATSAVLGLLLRIPDNPLSRSQMLLLCLTVGLSLALYMVTNIAAAVLQAYGRFTHYSVASATNSIVAVVGGLLAIWVWRSPIAILLGQCLGYLAFMAVSYRPARSAIGEPIYRPSWSRQHVGTLSALSFREVPNRIAQLVAGTVDKTLITATLGATVIGQYGRSARLPEALNDAAQPVSTTALPNLTRQHTVGPEAFSASVTRTAHMSLAFGMALVLVPGAFGLPFLTLWLRDKAPLLGPEIMLGVAFYRGIQMYVQAFSVSFFAAAKPQWNMPFSVFNALATVLLTVPAIRWQGLMGVLYMNAAINLLIFFPVSVMAKQKIAPALDLVGLNLRSAAILLIGCGFAAAGYAICQLPYMRQHMVLALFLAPFFMAGCLGTLILMRICPIPDGLRDRLRGFRARLARQ